MCHTILLLQIGPNPRTRTFWDFASFDDCIKGICKMYEEHLIRSNPYSWNITYDISQLLNYLDQYYELSCLMYQRTTNTYAPCNKDWIKVKIYVSLRQAASELFGDGCTGFCFTIVRTAMWRKR